MGTEHDTRREHAPEAGVDWLAARFLIKPSAADIELLRRDITDLSTNPDLTRDEKGRRVDLVNQLLYRFGLRLEVEGRLATLVLRPGENSIQFQPLSGRSFGGFSAEARCPGPGRPRSPREFKLVPYKSA